MSTNENPATETPTGLSIRLTLNANSLINLICAVAGAGTVIGIFTMLQYAAGIFTAIMPFVMGTALFLTIVATFGYLVKTQRLMRQNAKFSVSLAEGYTAVSIFVIMGLFAMACMHAFQGDGLALGLWTKGVGVSVAAASLYGLGKFFSSLWKDGGAAKSGC